MKTIAFIDLGTNSCRLTIAKIMDNGVFSEIGRYKEVVRLGTGEFETNHLTEEAMERTIFVLKQFAAISEKFNVDGIFGVATAAVREAENKLEFIARAKEESGIDLKIVSGI